MAKVVTNAGTEEFKAPPKEVKAEAKPELAEPVKAAPPPEEKAEVKTDSPLDDEGIDPEDKDLSEHIRKKIGKKHRQMKEAQEAQADAEAFAKGQYDRARLAEEKLAQAERVLAESRKPELPKAPELKKPDVKDFTDDKGAVRWTDYTEAVGKYSAEKALADKEIADREAQRKQAQDKEAAERAEVVRRFNEGAEKIPNFQDRLNKANVWLPNAVLEFITEQDNGPQISVYLAEHPDEAERISKLRPLRAMNEISKLDLNTKPEPKKETPLVAERSGAPPPITPISGTSSGSVNTDPARMSFKELREYERAKRHKR